MPQLHAEAGEGGEWRRVGHRVVAAQAQILGRAGGAVPGGNVPYSTSVSGAESGLDGMAAEIAHGSCTDVPPQRK